MTFEMVIHTEFGGFSLTDEIVRQLHKRNCPWAQEITRTGSGTWYPPARLALADDDISSLRRDPDLIAVVKELQEKLDRAPDMSWKERAALERRLLCGLKVVTVGVCVEIRDYDGKEQIRVSGGVIT